MFGKKAGSVINLMFVFYLLILYLIENLGVFNRFFAKQSDVSRQFTETTPNHSKSEIDKVFNGAFLPIISCHCSANKTVFS